MADGFDKALRGLAKTMRDADRALQAAARDQAYLDARYVGKEHGGGTVTKAKRLNSGRVLLTVNRADGSRQQFVVEGD